MISAFGNSLQSHIFWTIFGGHLSKASDDICELVGAASQGGENGHHAVVTVEGRKVDVIKVSLALILLILDTFL